MRNLRTYYFVALLSLLFFLPAAVTWANDSPEPTEEGLRLLEAIHAKDNDAFEQALIDGADPNEIVGQFDRDWSMCAATQPEREWFLRKLLDAGGNPELVTPQDPVIDRPTVCSMLNGNKAAFEILISAGANPNAIICADCGPSTRATLFDKALRLRTFDIALRLFEIAELSPSDMLYAKELLERQSTLQSETTAAMAAHLEARGIKVTLPPASQ